MSTDNVTANERTFQGVLLNQINTLITSNKKINFSKYNIYFKDSNKQRTVSFETSSQIKLFKFFYDELEIKGTELNLPKSPEDCERIYKVLVNDFNKYSPQIKTLLKMNRSKANYFGVYREIILN